MTVLGGMGISLSVGGILNLDRLEYGKIGNNVYTIATTLYNGIMFLLREVLCIMFMCYLRYDAMPFCCSLRAVGKTINDL